jgi:hypothetical protein
VRIEGSGWFCKGGGGKGNLGQVRLNGRGVWGVNCQTWDAANCNGVQSTCDALLVTCCCFFSMFAPHPKTQIDQAALTGESLPVKKFTSGVAFSGSTVKMGERHCVVYATGVNTFFGRAAALISGTVNVANIQKVMTKIGAICLVTIGIWVIIELAVQFGHYGHECTGGEEGCPTLTNMLVIIVGGIPIAMPTVLSVTLALGAAALAKEGAIVARMSAVEECVCAGGGRDSSRLLLVQRLKPSECCGCLSLFETSNFMAFSILLSLTRILQIAVCHLQAYTAHVSFAWHNDCLPMAAGWPAWISCAVTRLAR